MHLNLNSYAGRVDEPHLQICLGWLYQLQPSAFRYMTKIEVLPPSQHPVPTSALRAAAAFPAGQQLSMSPASLQGHGSEAAEVLPRQGMEPGKCLPESELGTNMQIFIVCVLE